MYVGLKKEQDRETELDAANFCTGKKGEEGVSFNLQKGYVWDQPKAKWDRGCNEQNWVKQNGKAGWIQPTASVYSLDAVEQYFPAN